MSQSPGPDDIPNAFLKQYTEWCSKYLCALFTQLLQEDPDHKCPQPLLKGIVVAVAVHSAVLCCLLQSTAPWSFWRSGHVAHSGPASHESRQHQSERHQDHSHTVGKCQDSLSETHQALLQPNVFNNPHLPQQWEQSEHSF